MKVCVDVGLNRLSKYNEEVCGDTAEIIRTDDATTCIFSDGLGSGIKASILSILTTKIAAGLLKRKVNLEQVFATLAETLPNCKVRNLAYATLSILKIDKKGCAHLIEYDNPHIILLRAGRYYPIERKQRQVEGKQIQEASFKVQEGDVFVVISDGVINAGVGDGLYKLGLGSERLIENILQRQLYTLEAEKMATSITDLAEACYFSKPGDDTTAIVLKVRLPKPLIILTGPPREAADDAKMVQQLMSFSAEKVICGGATSNMVARELARPLKTNIAYIDPSVPPTASLEGFSLVTEGILTLNKCVEKLKGVVEAGVKLKEDQDGATLLAQKLLAADELTFLVGSAHNPAHEDIMRSLQLQTRKEAIKKIQQILGQMGKKITVLDF